MMRKYLSFHLSYFDLDRNFPGSLSSKMSIDTIQLKAFTKGIFGHIYIAMAIFICFLIVGCCF
jgi:hypothetical protein